jgi:hypothetical protein
MEGAYMSDRSANPMVRGVVFGMALALGLVGTLGLASGRLPAVRAQGSSGAGEPGGTIAFTSATRDAGELLYVVDTRNQAFAVYRVDPRDPKGAVKLEAARQYRWDLKLAEFNNQAPEVATIESMVGAPRR